LLVQKAYHKRRCLAPYAVNFKKRPVILSSALGFELKDGSMKTDFALLDTKKSSKDETWTQPWLPVEVKQYV
jgi:hypothetical protein